MDRSKDLLDQALDLSPDERAAFLAEACGEDADLLAELSSLVRASEQAGGFLGGDTASSPAAREGDARGPTKDGGRIGDRIGEFTLLEQLGEGGFGVVFRAEQLEPIRRRVALKLVRLGMGSVEVLARFEAERQALARMSHPNVAQVLGGGVTEGGQPYFVMELVEGPPLTTYCDRERLPIEARLRLFVDVCRGVHHAHQKGIVHRDLKPSNLLVAEHDGRALPKVIDFGVAKALEEPISDRTITRVRQVVGTPDYMAPEQAAARALDTRADIYSLGVLLYELISGTKPFDSSTLREGGLAEYLRHVQEVDPPRPSTRVRQLGSEAGELATRRGQGPGSLARTLRGDLDWIVLCALRKDPDRRYASAAALGEDVLRHLAHEPVSAGPPSALYRLGKFARRNRPGVAAALITAVALVAALGITRSEKLRADQMAEVARREKNHVLSLSAFQRLADLRDEAEQLWPADATTIDEATAWMERAHEVVAGLQPSPAEESGGHYAMLETLRERALESGTDDEGNRWWTFATDEDRWWHAQLEQLVNEIEAFADPETGLVEGVGPPHGWGVARRLAQARALESKSLTGELARARWADAIRSIADARECPEYDGLAITPQLGLLPLGRNPRSGLWEFLCVQSGDEPERSPQGWLAPSPGSGIVLALIPGGLSLLGAQASDEFGANYDPLAQPEESPIRELTLDPYFLGIHEVTQGQWERFTGENPSNYVSGVEYAEQMTTDQNPVEQVSWEECMRFLERLGLTLPTEAQWEHGNRAGSLDPWWTGPAREDLRGAANVRDDSVRIHGVSWHPIDEWIDDGHVVHSEVARFEPNDFGLYDVHGNVWEWCRDEYATYDAGIFQPGDGLHTGTTGKLRAYRGGSFFQQARDCRSAVREGFPADSRHNNIGVRAARPLVPEADR